MGSTKMLGPGRKGEEMATFVLVHGAFQGGWVWHPVASLLRSEGHVVFTPTLTGSGEREHLLDPSIDLNTYIRDVTNLIYFEALNQVILVGHSYAGVVITGVANKLQTRISHLVYVDAMVPEDGKSVVDIAGPEFSQMLEKHVSGDLVRPWPPEVFGVHCEEDKRWFSLRLSAFPLRAFNTVFREHTPNQSVRRSYIHCTVHRNLFIKRIAAECRLKGWDYKEIETGHSPMVSAPDQLAELLHRISLTDVGPKQRFRGQRAKAGGRNGQSTLS
jgi:pimeloyl-ACP methyl ester carboxylesterase